MCECCGGDCRLCSGDFKDLKNSCIECKSTENLTYSTHPFEPYKNILICEKCQYIPFYFLKNVKSFEHSKHAYEEDENFKIRHNRLGILMDEIIQKYHSS